MGTRQIYTEDFPVPHGLMFHHFHSDAHPVGQGSISAEDLYRIIDVVGRNNILDAEEWLARAREGKLGSRDYCLTFDDNLRCQYDVARPVMDALEIRGFWFVYTSSLQGTVERMELYRYFRSIRFPDFDDFFEAFLIHLRQTQWGDDLDGVLNSEAAKSYLNEFEFYSLADRQFRYVRDIHLSAEVYESVMDSMIAASTLDINDIHRKLWMDGDTLKILEADSHVIGTHSHTHPTRIDLLEDEKLHTEHEMSHDVLSELLGNPPRTMSHPCNAWNERTLEVLSQLEFDIGFTARLDVTKDSPFLYPRHDHADIMAYIENTT